MRTQTRLLWTLLSTSLWTLLSIGLLLGLAACPAEAPSPDAGVPDGAGTEPGCGDVTVQGFCAGDTLTYCDEGAEPGEADDEVVVVNCQTAYPERETTCIEVTDAYGSDCAVELSGDCLLDDGTILFCQGADPGCLDDRSGFTCTEGLGPCTSADEGRCFEERLLSVCVVNQPFVVDCPSYGGTCSGAEGACRMPAGALCDGIDFICAAGLTCTNGTCS